MRLENQGSTGRPPTANTHVRKDTRRACQLFANRRSFVPLNRGWQGCNGRWGGTPPLRPNQQQMALGDTETGLWV